MVGTLLITLLRHADRVKVACLAQLVNVIAPIMTEPGGPAWRQTHLPPVRADRPVRAGTVLRLEPRGPVRETGQYGEVPLLDAVAVHDEDAGGLTVFAVNRDQHEPMAVDLDLRGLAGLAAGEHTTLAGERPGRGQRRRAPGPGRPPPARRGEAGRRPRAGRAAAAVLEHGPVPGRVVIDGTGAGPVAPTAGASGRLHPVPLGAARITGGLWAARQRVNREVAIPAGHKHLEAAGNLDNLRAAAGTTTGAARGPLFMDSDVYKWLEAVAWEHGREPAPELLEAQREVTAVVAAAQQPDGYLDSVVQLRDRGERYRDLPWSHEHYCAGHLFQAAVAQARATGDRGLLDIAVRLADHLVATFGPGRRRDVDGHPVVEMALVELYRETGTAAYLELGRFFVEARGHGLMAGYGEQPTYFSDRVPVREQSTVEGHAVRAVYLAAGAADVAAETGDAELLGALGDAVRAHARDQDLPHRRSRGPLGPGGVR